MIIFEAFHILQLNIVDVFFNNADKNWKNKESLWVLIGGQGRLYIDRQYRLNIGCKYRLYIDGQYQILTMFIHLSQSDNEQILYQYQALHQST